MKLKMFTIFLIVAVMLSSCAIHPKLSIKNITQQDHFELDGKIMKNINLKFLLHLPDNYPGSDNEFPLILFLHGAGERGNELEKVKAWGPPRIADVDKSFPFIVVSPQCPEGDWWTSFNQQENLHELLKTIISKYKVDEDRVYLTGLSMGGYGTWALACEYPEMFAAIAPICGGGKPRPVRKLKNIPTWVFHGGEDKVVPVSESEIMVDACKKYGIDVKFTLFPEAGHNSWSQAYNKTNLFDWFLEHKRK